MGKDARHIAIIAALAMMLLIAGAVIGGLIGHDMAKETCKQLPPDTVTNVVTIDTMTVTLPPDTVTNVVTKVVMVPISDVDVDFGVDSARITLPIERHHARLGDVADVWYSGYDAKLDSARTYHRTVTEVIREPYEVKQPVRSNFLGVEAGVHDASLMYVRRMGAVSVGFSAGAVYQDRSPTARLVVGINF